jgi:cell division protein FtsZ
VEVALGSPLLDGGKILISSAHVLVHITADASLSLAEVQAVVHRLAPHITDTSQIMLGVATDDTSDALGVTLMVGTRSGMEETAEAGEQEGGDTTTAESEEAVAGELPGLNGHQRPAKTEGKRGGKKGAPQATQDELPLDQAMRGRFRDLTPTMEDGQDLDIPTYIRLRLRLK